MPCSSGTLLASSICRATVRKTWRNEKAQIRKRKHYMKANLTFQRKGGANLCQKCQKTEDEQKLPAKVHKLKLVHFKKNHVYSQW